MPEFPAGHTEDFDGIVCQEAQIAAQNLPESACRTVVVRHRPTFIVFPEVSGFHYLMEQALSTLGIRLAEHLALIKSEHLMEHLHHRRRKTPHPQGIQ